MVKLPFYPKQPFRLFYRPLLFLVILIAFTVNTLGPLPIAQADDFHLPLPGVMVPLSPPLDPPLLKGIKVHPDNPFRFDFILDRGDGQLSNVALKEESSKLIKYFLASLTIPEKDLWVNLSPYEKDRIIPNSFGLTEMGRDLLAEDYILKQITASLIYPEGKIGREFWKMVYKKAEMKYGTTNVPINTFNKVWIVPEKAVVYENVKAGTVYVVESKLKVMLEQDYLSLAKHEGIQSAPQAKDTNQLGSQVVREIVIPELAKEVNENKNFAHLRQVYNSLILATWYKKKIKDSILEQVYADKNKTAGVGYADSLRIQTIYQRYLAAFKKGVFNYIKEEEDPMTQEATPREYFSGGFAAGKIYMDRAMVITTQMPQRALETDHAMLITVQVDRAMDRPEYDFGNMVAAIDRSRGQSMIFTLNDPWQIFYALGKLKKFDQPHSNVFAPLKGKPINGDRTFIDKLINLDSELDTIISENGWTVEWQGNPNHIPDYIDAITWEFVSILQNSLLSGKPLPIRKYEDIIRQFKDLKHPLATAMPTIDEWLAYSFMELHEDYLKRIKALAASGRPMSCALFFAANGPHTRRESLDEDKNDIEAQQYLINAFIGPLYDGLKNFKNLNNQKKRLLRKYISALLNGLLVRSDRSYLSFLKDLSKGIKNKKISLKEIIRLIASLNQMPDQMAAFYHFVGATVGTAEIDHLAYWNSRHGKAVTMAQLYLGISSKDADEYRDIVETAERGSIDNHRKKYTETVEETGAKYEYLRIWAMGSQANSPQASQNPAMVADFHQERERLHLRNKSFLSKGGIDLTPANMNLQTQNAGEAIKFHLNPARLAQLQNAPGFVPVIINIQPLKDLRGFLAGVS